MNKVAYIITGDGTITLFIHNKNYAIDKEHLNYSKIKENLINKNYDNISSLVDISDSVIRKSMGKVTIKNGIVYYGNKPIHNAITKQIVNLVKQDFPFDFMVNEVNPKDVVSVPTDYKHTKIRVCEYLVVAEYDKDDIDMFEGDSVRNSDGSKYIQTELEDGCDDCDDCDDCGIDACECGLCECQSLSKSWNNEKQDDNACNPKASSVKYHNVRGKDGKFVKKNK